MRKSLGIVLVVISLALAGAAGVTYTRYKKSQADIQRARATGGERGAEVPAAPIDVHLQDVFLVREVAVEGPGRDVRFGDDLVDGHVLEPAEIEEPERHGLQLLDHELRTFHPQLKGE